MTGRGERKNRLTALPPTLRLLFSLLVILGGILLLPLGTAVILGERSEAAAFAAVAGGSLAVGFLGRTRYRDRAREGVRPALLCTGAWLLFSLVGAIPFVLARGLDPLDAFFETVSGLTTTGITMFSGLDAWPRSLLLWRSLTQWVGGLGILTFFLGLSFRGTGDHRLFGAESHKIELGRPVPGLAHTLRILWAIYLLLTAAVGAGLLLAGMTPFDALCHCLTTLSTGGFSPHDASIGFYAGNRAIEWILIAGMLAGGINFLVHYRLLRGEVKALVDNTEIRYFFFYVAAFSALILLERAGRTGALSAGDGRGVLFQVSSILTTTGFATEDIGGAFFGPLARQLFLLMMVIGGCVGSTAGGFKVLRTAILTREVRRELFQLRISRHAVNPVVVDGKAVPVTEIRRVGALFFAWISLLLAGGLVTTMFTGLGGLQALSGMASALGNVGPCFIPQGQMAELPGIVKGVYILGMLAGRLEILPVLIFLNPRFWR